MKLKKLKSRHGKFSVKQIYNNVKNEYTSLILFINTTKTTTTCWYYSIVWLLHGVGKMIYETALRNVQK